MYDAVADAALVQHILSDFDVVNVDSALREIAEDSHNWDNINKFDRHMYVPSSVSDAWPQLPLVARAVAYVMANRCADGAGDE